MSSERQKEMISSIKAIKEKQTIKEDEWEDEANPADFIKVFEVSCFQK